MNIKKPLLTILLCVFVLYGQIAPMQEGGVGVEDEDVATKEDSVLVLSGIEAAHWLEQNFADPILYLNKNLDYLRYIYNVKIYDPKSVISILKNPPFNLVFFSDEKPLHLSREKILPRKLQQKINKNVRSLDLSYNELNSFKGWQEIANIKQLRSLYLNWNKLDQLHFEYWQVIASMTHLRSLDLSINDLYNLFTKCWQVIASMTHLLELNLRRNHLNKLPIDHWETIANMTHLRKLDLRGNKLDKLPIKHWRVIANMTHLRELDLRWNGLNHLLATNPRIQLIRNMQEQGVTIILE